MTITDLLLTDKDIAAAHERGGMGAVVDRIHANANDYIPILDDASLDVVELITEAQLTAEFTPAEVVAGR